MTFIVTLLALAAIGAATLAVIFGLLLIDAVAWGWRKARRRGETRKVVRELRELEVGTCDGLQAWQITYVVEELWNPSASR